MDYLTTRIIYIIILVAGTAIGFYRWKRNSTPFKILTIIIATVLFFDGGGILVRVLLKINLLVIVSRLFAPLEVGLYAAIFLSLIKKRKFAWPIIVSAALVIIFITAYDLLRPDNTHFDTLPILIKCYYYILLSLLIFHEYMVYPNESNILREQTFWFISAVLFVNTMVIMYWSCFMLMTTPPRRSLGEAIMITGNFIYYSAIAYILNMKPSAPLIKTNEIG